MSLLKKLSFIAGFSGGHGSNFNRGDHFPEMVTMEDDRYSEDEEEDSTEEESS